MVPAESTSIAMSDFVLSTTDCMTPSPVGDRQMFPIQTNRTRFFAGVVEESFMGFNPNRGRTADGEPSPEKHGVSRGRRLSSSQNLEAACPIRVEFIARLRNNDRGRFILQ